MKKDVVQYFRGLSKEEQDKRYKAALNVAEARYGTDFQNIVYNQNKEKYNAGEITWEEAVKKTEKSKEYKDLVKEYEIFFSDKLEEYTKEYKK